MVVLVCLASFTMILVLGIVLWKFRRYFLTIISIFTFSLLLISVLYNFGIFNGYIDLEFKGINVKEDVTVNGDVNVKGNVTVDKDVTVKGDTNVKGNVTVDKDVTVKGDTNVNGNVTVDKDVTVKGDTNVNGSVNVDKDVNVGGDVNIKGSVTVDEDVNVKGDVKVDGDVVVGGDVIVDGKVEDPKVVDDGKGGAPVDTTVHASGITVSPSNLDLKIGESSYATATVSPSNATNKNINWTSNNSSIATVNSNGQIVGKSVGTAVITATSVDGGYSDTCIVTVKTSTVAVSSLIVSPSNTNLNVGESLNATATISPSNATNKNINWTSNNSSVATVNSNGQIVGVSAGTAVITATSVDGGYSDTCVVTVKASTVAVSGLTVSPSNTTLNVGETSYATATVYPSNATNKNVNWSSNNNSVATVNSNGQIVGVSAGTAVITATSVDGGYSDTCVVTVKTSTIAVSGLTVSPSNTTLNVGNTSYATATVYPSNATNKNVNWTSNNSSVATVNSNGQIVGVSAGTAVITATSVDGGYSDTCVVTVKANEVVTNATVKITFGDHIDGATEMFASVVISEGGKTPTIESNLNCEVTKVNDTVYHVRMTITEGSHGTVALSVSGNGITTTQNTNSY
jgi:uncharacterized protein YjdB